MPRAGGVYTLPAGNPVVTLTVISSSWANTTMSDIATALTGSLPTDGSAPMTGPLRLSDGLIGAPGLTWGTETTSGWYRIGAGDFGFSITSTKVLELTPTVATVFGSSVTGGITLNITNTSAVSGDTSTVSLVANATNFALIAANLATSGTIVANGPTGAQGVIRTLGSAAKLVFGTNNSLAGFFDVAQQLNLSTTGGAAPTSFGPVYSGLPSNSQAGNYVFVLADANKCVAQSGAAATTTIPANSSVAFPIGTMLSVYNNTAGNITIPITTDNMRFGPSSILGTRTLAQNGLATIWKIAATTWVITGSGVS
jgi:hypothetical protein